MLVGSKVYEKRIGKAKERNRKMGNKIVLMLYNCDRIRYQISMTICKGQFMKHS